MQKILAYLVLLLLPLAARGQALSDWYYWFDTDKVPQKSGQVSDQKFRLEADVSNLSIGAHTLFVQVVDTAGVYSPPIGTWFYHVPDSKNMDKLFYHVGEGNMMHSVDFGDGKFELDVSGISTGLHALNLQVMDKNGSVSAINTYLFYKVPASAKVEKLRYWIDGSQDIKEEAYGQTNFLIDVSECVPGFHFIYYYVVDAEGNPSTVQSAGFYRMPMESRQKLYYWFAGDTIATEVKDFANGFVADVTHVQEGFNTLYTQIVDYGPTDIEAHHFIKVAQTEGSGDLTVACIIDGKLAAEEKVSCHGGVMKLDMDVSNIEVGMHKALFQVITPTGAGSSIAETYFIRTLTNDDIASMQCSYTIDGFKHYTQKGSLTNGTFHFDLPVDEVEDGLHRIDFMLVAENGATTTQGNAWFFKTPVGGNVIRQYDYWLNDKADEVQSVTLDEPKDPFQLIKLIPVSSEPIRSSCFHFEVKDGNPTMYAKNDIHFRFHDTSGRWVDADKQYVDYNTSEVVTDIAELQSTQTFERPDSNCVKWFKFEAETGDTIAFKASQATSLQVFAPNGEEIYSASGDKSVKYGGVHTWEDGTYYVAVHDVTGTKPNITLDYMHMDRYDVVSQDVHVVGNGGCSTITFQGNGFRDLYKVDLYTAHGDTIHSIDVGHESDASTTVTFDFTGAELGKYNALFHFTEEDKTFVNNITVEEAKDIELATKVSYPSTFLRGTSTTFTFEITNKGNSTAYQVPVNIQFFAERGCQDITYAKYSENIPKVSMDWLCPEIYPQETIDAMNAFVEEKGDLLRLINVVDTLKGVSYKDSYLAINIAPNSTFSFTITLKSGSEVRALMSIPDVWNFVSIKEAKVGAQYKYKAAKSSAKENMCCAREHVECFMNVIVSALDFASIFGPNWSVADCIGALANEGLQFAYDVWCGETYGGKNAGEAAKDLRWTAVNTLLSCLPPGVDKYNLVWIYEHIYDVISTTMDCVQSLSEIKGCPPNPPLPIGPSTPVNSYDPNDIYGYIAPSGSMYVGDEILTLPYRIEFENDTTFATSSAHKVVVKDTLDAKVFDLASYQPTSIKIGDKDVQLNGDKEFVTTVDMRPAINAIAQVEGKYDEKKGIATWQFTSLDPMTMEPTDDIMQGFLPVNYDGTSGIGEVLFDINLKQRFEEGTEISNRASIVFDVNDPIMTPTWVNTVDATSPTSHVTNVEMKNDSTFTIHFEGEDNLSGVWHYDVYYRWKDNMDWICIANGCDSTALDKTAAFGYKYEFCVVATDSAGNVEQKELAPEFEFYTGLLGDVNKDSVVTVADVSGVVSLILQEPGTEAMNTMAADVNRDGNISIVDASGIVSIILGVPQESKSRRVSAAVVEKDDSVFANPIETDLEDMVEVPLYMSGNAEQFTSVQLDLSLPQGVSLANVKGTDDHVCAYSQIDGKNRIVCLSMTNSRFSSADSRLLTLVLKVSAPKPAVANMVLENVELATPKMTTFHPHAVTVPMYIGDVTAIDGVKVNSAEQSVYDLNGRQVKDAQNGVFIKNGKSVLVK